MINTYLFKEQQHYYFDDYGALFKNKDILNEFKKLDVVKYSDEDFKFEYVGIIIFGDNVLYCYPKYFPKKDVVDNDFKQIMDVIKKFNKQRNNSVYQNDDFENSPYNMLSLMLFFIEDYYENGLYTKTQDVMEINGNGDIDWNRTINQEFPIIQNGKPYYTELQTRYHQNDLVNYFRLFHKSIITYCSKTLQSYNLLELFDLNSVELSRNSWDEDFGDKEFIKERLQKELNVEFNTHKRNLLNAMYSFICNDNSTRENILTLYGSNEYYSIWENICAEIFEDNLDDTLGVLFKDKLNKKHFSPSTELKNVISKPKICLDDMDEEFPRLIPDSVILSEDKNQLIILDGKYRNLYKNKSMEDTLRLYDVNKQFLYQLAFSELIEFQNINCVKNALLFPTYGKDVKNKGFIESDMFQRIGMKKIQVILVPAHEVSKCYLEGNKKPIKWLELDNI